MARKKDSKAQQRPIPTHRLRNTNGADYTTEQPLGGLFGASFCACLAAGLENDAPMRRFLQTCCENLCCIFALLGGLSAAHIGFVRPVPRERIVIPKELVSARRGSFAAVGEDPDGCGACGGDVEYVESEVLYREAQRRRLGDGDIIIRRRLIQKMEYLADALILLRFLLMRNFWRCVMRRLRAIFAVPHSAAAGVCWL